MDHDENDVPQGVESVGSVGSVGSVERVPSIAAASPASDLELASTLEADLAAIETQLEALEAPPAS
jgi:hypothetical protein